MSLSEFSAFLPGLTNNNETTSNQINKQKKQNSNRAKIDLKKIQIDFKQLIDTIIGLIQDKKRLENELLQLKTNSQKQKNMTSNNKNSKQLLKYIELLDKYLIEVNSTLKDYPNEKAQLLTKLQNRINRPTVFPNEGKRVNKYSPALEDVKHKQMAGV